MMPASRSGGTALIVAAAFLLCVALVTGATVIHSCDGLAGVAVVDGAKLPQTQLELNTDPARLSEGGASLHVRSVSPPRDKAVYLSIDLALDPVDLRDKALVFDAWTTDPGITRALYVRGYDADGRCALSWMSWEGLLRETKTEFSLVPEETAAGVKWEPYKITAPDRSAVSRLRFYVGTQSGSEPFDLFLDNVRVTHVSEVVRTSAAQTKQVDRERFTDHGIGADIAELRGVVATRTAEGHSLVIATVTDQSPSGYLLVSDIDIGRTEQVFCPAGVPQVDPFGALLASSGRFYHTQGKVLLEFDPTSMGWTFQGVPSPNVSVYLCFTEGPDGTVWAGGVYETTLISFDPEKREMKDHGRMDPEEKYLQRLAVDSSGWVYAGVGTARCNLVAYNPLSGEKRQLLAEEKRTHGSGSVYPCADGTVHGEAAGRHYRLFEGTATPVTKDDARPRRDVGDIKYGGKRFLFPDGRRVLSYDLERRELKVGTADSGEVRTIGLDYRSGGASITSIGVGPDGVAYGSTCHPMHFLSLDTSDGKLRDMGAIPAVGGGNFCAIACQGRQVIGAQYAAGRLWAYDVDKPWHTGEARVRLGLTPSALMGEARIDAGHLSYLGSHDIVFVHGDRWGATAEFPLRVGASGRYWLHVAPYRHNNYCTGRFALDGKPLGQPYAANSATTEAGPVQVFGPLELAAGDHVFAVTMMEVAGASPFFGICGLELATQPRRVDELRLEPNPRVLAQWAKDVCRPRTALAHPDGSHVMMAGFAGYGLCGGGLGMFDLATGEATLLTAERDLLAGHSCITLKALPNGNLVGGTSISAPGGGHASAKEAELFVLDWTTRKLIHHAPPVAGETNIVSITVASTGRVYGLTGGSRLFVFDPDTREIVHRDDLRRFGSVPRHALHVGPDGKLYALLSDAVLRIDPESYEYSKLTDTPVAITAGGALLNGRLCFAARANVWSYRVPGL